MKKLLFIIGLFSLSALCINNLSFAKTTPPVKKAISKKTKIDGAPLVFWTSNRTYGPIEIFVNDVYQGDITLCYNSIPECAANGCVTVIINGDNNVWTAQTKDGKHKWASTRVRLTAEACNSEQLR